MFSTRNTPVVGWIIIMQDVGALTAAAAHFRHSLFNLRLDRCLLLDTFMHQELTQPFVSQTSKAVCKSKLFQYFDIHRRQNFHLLVCAQYIISGDSLSHDSHHTLFKVQGTTLCQRLLAFNIVHAFQLTLEMLWSESTSLIWASNMEDFSYTGQQICEPKICQKPWNNGVPCEKLRGSYLFSLPTDEQLMTFIDHRSEGDDATQDAEPQADERGGLCGRPDLTWVIKIKAALLARVRFFM